MTPRRRSGRRPGVIALGIAAAVLTAGGLATSAVWAVAGGEWDAAVSWRKPTLFCFSSAVTCLSLAWAVTLRSPRRFDAATHTAFAVAIVVEVGLITLQQARGVPSHFNTATDFDAAVLAGIKSTVAIVTAVIGLETLLACGRLRATADVRLAARAGLFLLLLSCLIGFVIELQGERELAAGRSPQTFGEAGVMKFPHGVPMHAIQILPTAAFLLRRVGARTRLRLLCVEVVASGVVAATAYAASQTLLGRGRFDPAEISIVVTAASVLIFNIAARARRIFIRG
ncbi:MAG: hypothetical protein AAF532_06450 [Planctomycetota bacterium]